MVMVSAVIGEEGEGRKLDRDRAVISILISFDFRNQRREEGSLKLELLKIRTKREDFHQI